MSMIERHMDDDSQSITTLTRGQIHLGNCDECDQQRHSRNRHQPSPAHSVSIRDHTIHANPPAPVLVLPTNTFRAFIDVFIDQSGS